MVIKCHSIILYINIVLSSEMFDRWRIVFERSNGAALVPAAKGDDASGDIPKDDWKYCDVDAECKDDDTLRVTG